MVQSSVRLGEVYERDFQLSDRKGLQALSASVGSNHTAVKTDGDINTTDSKP